MHRFYVRNVLQKELLVFKHDQLARFGIHVEKLLQGIINQSSGRRGDSKWLHLYREAAELMCDRLCDEVELSSLLSDDSLEDLDSPPAAKEGKAGKPLGAGGAVVTSV